MSDEKQQYEIIDIKSLEAFAKLHKICFRDREDSTASIRLVPT